MKLLRRKASPQGIKAATPGGGTLSKGAGVRDFALERSSLVPVLAGLAAAALAVPSISIVAAAAAAGLAALGFLRSPAQPIKIPIQANRKGRPCLDPHEPDAFMKPKPAAGMFYLGNETNTGKEIWLSDGDCRQHFLVLGESGSGKTEILTGFGANALNWSSGFMFVQAGSDATAFARIHALARFYGREDDLLVLNCMAGDRSGPLVANTMNPFATGSADSLAQMVISLMDVGGQDAALWIGRASALLIGIMRALCHLRDEGVISLDVGVVRDHLRLERIIDLADEARFPELAPAVRHTVKSYLSTLYGYQGIMGHRQAKVTLDHHGCHERLFERSLDLLSGAFGHVFAAGSSDIDMNDVVLNRRILVVLLPETSGPNDKSATPGQLVLSALKRMMGVTLGNRFDGSYVEIVHKRLAVSESPFVAICDDVGRYWVDGVDLMASSARALGFSMVYGAAEFSEIGNPDEKIADSIVGNTKTRIVVMSGDAPSGLDEKIVGGIVESIPPKVKIPDDVVGKVAPSVQDSMKVGCGDVFERVASRDAAGQPAVRMSVANGDQWIGVEGFSPNLSAAEGRVPCPRANEFVNVPLATAEDRKLWVQDVDEQLRLLTESLER